MDALGILTSLAVILLLAVLVTIISKKFKISNVLFLVLIGVALGRMTFGGYEIFDFSPVFLVAIGILALVLIVFDGASRFKLKEVDAFFMQSLKLVGIFLLLSVIFMSFFTHIMFYSEFTVATVIYSLIFAIIIVGTDASSVFVLMGKKANKVINVLELEAIVNTPIIVLLPFILIEFLNVPGGAENVWTNVLGQFGPFLQQIVVGIGVGVLLGIVIFKAMRKVYSAQLSPLAIITASLLSYILAEQLGGNGVLAVVVLGLFFGNMYFRQKEQLQTFNWNLSNLLQLLVFVLIGVVIKIDFTLIFILKSLGLFALLILVRYWAIRIAMKKEDYNNKERFFMAMNMPKGIAVAVVVFSFSVLQYPLLGHVLDLVLIFMIYSLALASILDRYSQKFIRVKLDQ
ncbi:MAG: cation:proton antiporter [archaeon]